MEKKFCLYCQKEFFKRKDENKNKWAKRKFCSQACANKAKKGKTPDHLKKYCFKKGQHFSPSTEFKKGIIPWNKNKKIYFSPEAIQKIRYAHLGRKASPKTKEKISFALKRYWQSEKSKNHTFRKGKDHPNFKENADYSTVHRWVRKNWEKSGICEICKKRIKTDWACKDHRYIRERQYWLELCRECHIQYDLKNGFYQN